MARLVDNFDEHAKQLVVDFIITLVLLVAIVFFAIEDFAVAYETFKGAMTSGLKKISTNMIQCLLREIVALAVTGDWHLGFAP